MGLLDNEVIKCPFCDKINKAEVSVCVHCGEKIPENRKVRVEIKDLGAEKKDAVSRDFGTLMFIGQLNSFIGWLLVAGSVIAIIIGLSDTDKTRWWEHNTRDQGACPRLGRWRWLVGLPATRAAPGVWAGNAPVGMPAPCGVAGYTLRRREPRPGSAARGALPCAPPVRTVVPLRCMSTAPRSTTAAMA